MCPAPVDLEWFIMVYGISFCCLKSKSAYARNKTGCINKPKEGSAISHCSPIDILVCVPCKCEHMCASIVTKKGHAVCSLWPAFVYCIYMADILLHHLMVRFNVFDQKLLRNCGEARISGC